jgi:hypothetical protein
MHISTVSETCSIDKALVSASTLTFDIESSSAKVTSRCIQAKWCADSHVGISRMAQDRCQTVDVCADRGNGHDRRRGTPRGRCCICSGRRGVHTPWQGATYACFVSISVLMHVCTLHVPFAQRSSLRHADTGHLFVELVRPALPIAVMPCILFAYYAIHMYVCTFIYAWLASLCGK